MQLNTILRAVALVAVPVLAPSAFAAPLITNITQHGTGLNAQPPIATSATNRLPQPEGNGTQGALADEAYIFVTRTHEFTAVRTDPTTGALTTNATTGTLQPFPTYLNGIEYVQFANENRSVADFSTDMDFSDHVQAFLFIDNRNTGGSSGTKSSTSDPALVGNYAWVLSDGWKRVNTGFMPNGAPDYIASDEGATVASADLRTHTASGNVAGSGNGINNFFAIYTRDFPAGSNFNVTRAQGNGSPNYYGLAVIPTVPEPTLVLPLSVITACVLRRRCS